LGLHQPVARTRNSLDFETAGSLRETPKSGDRSIDDIIGNKAGLPASFDKLFAGYDPVLSFGKRDQDLQVLRLKPFLAAVKDRLPAHRVDARVTDMKWALGRQVDPALRSDGSVHSSPPQRSLPETATCLQRS